ncbi:hypothetical protein AMECASPLE_023868 [Ameca splendens]|uniref:Uncharacterized protein n=1 Tax=Ameca splendens TaxID=208324 RepID=A0ABV1A0Q4_9TELE
MVPFMTASLPGPEAAKQLQAFTLPPPYLLLDDVPFLECCDTFSADVPGLTPSKKFCLFRQSTFPKVIKMSSGKTEIFLLFSSGFGLESLPWRPFIPGLSFFWWRHKH